MKFFSIKMDQRLEISFSSHPKITSLDPEIAYDLFREIGISSAHDNDLRIFDQKDGLYLIHYIRPTPEVRHVKGIIYQYSSKWSGERILCVSFPWTLNITYTPSQKLDYNFSNYYCSIAEEGTILRIFND